MATAPPTPASNTRPASQPLRIPPDETMWKKYSPHGEAPLSFVGSTATHLLVLVLMVVLWALGMWYFNPPLPDIPVDTVHMPGGGGGNPKGEGEGPGFGGGSEAVGDPEDEHPQPVDTNMVKRPPLTVNEVRSDKFGVNIIPHTASVTLFGTMRPGDDVNIEIDMLARYVARLAETT